MRHILEKPLQRQTGSQRLPASSTQSKPTASAPSEWLTGRVHVFLQHYWDPRDDPDSYGARLKDWARSLRAFPQAVVERAIQDFQDHERRRPVIADIRTRCIKAMPRSEPPPPAPPPPAPSPEAKARIAALIDDLGLRP